VGFYEDKEAMKLLHIQFLEGWQYFYKMLAADKEVSWILFRNQSHKPLVTSDNPVVVIPNLDAQIDINNFLEQFNPLKGTLGKNI